MHGWVKYIENLTFKWICNKLQCCPTKLCVLALVELEPCRFSFELELCHFLLNWNFAWFEPWKICFVKPYPVHSSIYPVFPLRYVYTLRLIGPISYLGACYIRTKVTKCIREKMTMYFRGLTIKSHSSGYEIVPINRSV